MGSCCGNKSEKLETKKTDQKHEAHVHTVKDPVCGMDVDPADAEEVTFQGKDYFFCSSHCAAAFREKPDDYLDEVAKAKREAQAPKGAIYTCPMHPEIKQVGPGNCPICGMALEPVEASLEEGPNPEFVDFTRRLKWSLVFAIPLLLMAMGEMLFGMPSNSWTKSGLLNWIQLVLAAPVVVWAGYPLFHRGWVSIKTRNLNMFTLIALGTGVAFVYSVVATFAPGVFPDAFRGHSGQVGVYFEAAAVIVTLVLLGQVLELRARGQTNQAIQSLLKLAPKSARIVRPDGSEDQHQY